MKHLKLFNNSGERIENTFNGKKIYPFVSFTNDETKRIDFYELSNRIAEFEATDDNKLAVNSLLGFSKFIVDGVDILSGLVPQTPSLETFVVDEESFTFEGDDTYYIGETFPYGVHSYVKLSCDEVITDELRLICNHTYDDKNVAEALGSVGELIKSGTITRLNDNTVFITDMALITSLKIKDMVYFVFVGENVIPTKNEALVYVLSNTTTNSFTNTENSLVVDSDFNATYFENIVSGLPTRWDVSFDTTLNPEEILLWIAISNRQACFAMPIVPLSALNESGFGELVGSNVTIYSSLFLALLSEMPDIEGFGVYLSTNEENYKFLISNHVVEVSEMNSLLVAPYYFENNGKHIVEMECFNGMQFVCGENFYNTFDGGCITTLNNDALDGASVVKLTNVNQLKTITIPKDCVSFSVVKNGIPSLSSIKIKNGGLCKKYDNSLIIDGNGKYVLSNTNDETYELPNGVKYVDFNILNEWEPNIKKLSIKDDECVVDYTGEMGYGILENLTSVTAYNNNFNINFHSANITEFYNYADDISVIQCGKVNNTMGTFGKSGKHIKFYGNASSDGRFLLSSSGVVKYYNYINNNGTYSMSCIFPDEVKRVEYGVFNDLYYGSSIFSCHGNMKIGKDAFLNNTKISTIMFKEGVEIGVGSFNGCSSLDTIYFNTMTLPSIDKPFKRIGTSGTLIVPNGCDYSNWMKNEDGYLGYYGWTVKYYDFDNNVFL